MENITTKEQLIEVYSNDYESIYYRPFLELSLTKLGNLSENNPVKLTENQKINIQNKLNDNIDIDKNTFLRGLEELSFDQIQYVGW